ASDLQRSDLFVQLLSPTSGRKGRGIAAPLPRLQFERARAARLPIMQWCEGHPRPGQVGDAGHARLFDTEFLRATNLASFKTEVIEHMRAASNSRERAQRVLSEARPSTRASRKVVFLDDVASVPEDAERVRALIREQKFDLHSVPLGSEGIDLKE